MNIITEKSNPLNFINMTGKLFEEEYKRGYDDGVAAGIKLSQEDINYEIKKIIKNLNDNKMRRINSLKPQRI